MTKKRAVAKRSDSDVVQPAKKAANIRRGGEEVAVDVPGVDVECADNMESNAVANGGTTVVLNGGDDAKQTSIEPHGASCASGAGCCNLGFQVRNCTQQ